MTRLRYRSVVLSSVGFVTAVAFAGCSGLDDRKVTRGADLPNAGASEGGNGTGNGGVGDTGGGGTPDGQAGEGPTPPLGGDTSTGGAPPDPAAPPEVIRVEPADDEEDVAPTSNVSLTFSEELAPETVTAEAVTVSDGDEVLAGSISYESATATFEPSGRLSLLATYDVKVSTDVTDTTGDPLKGPFASRFTVRDGSWARQSSVATDPATVGDHVTGIDAEGNVLVVYTRPLDITLPKGPKTVAARWIPVARTIREEVLLEDNGTPCTGIKVAVDAAGNAFAFWQSEDAGGNPVMRGRRYVNGSWERSAQNIVPEGPATLIDSVTSSAVAIGAGQVVAAWVRYYYQSSTPYYVMEYTSTSLEGAWSEKPISYETVTNNSPNYESFDGVQAAVDAKGTALTTFAWRSNRTAVNGTFFVRRAPGRDWDNPVKIPTSNVPASVQAGPSLASDGDGAMAVWIEYLSSAYRLRASRYTPARQFAEPVEIGDPKLTTYARLESQGGLATNGKSYWVTWTQSLGNAQNVYVKRYDVATSAWDAEPKVVSDGLARAESATIGVDGHGNVLVGWDQSAVNNTFLVSFARYAAGSGRWSDPAALTDPGTYYEQPVLSVANNGVASVFFISRANETRPSAKNTAGSYRIFK